MTWQELPGETSKIKIHESGKITWNPCAHSMMGAPTGVVLFYDVMLNRVGLLRKNREPDYCPVLYTEEHEFEIDASEQLGSVSISVDSLYVAVLHGPTMPNPQDPPMQAAENGLVWFDAPPQ